MVEKRSYNYGIALLRLVAMYMVVTIHVMGEGGAIIYATGIGYSLSKLIETFTYCAVDCYALISGYVCYRDENENYRYSKYLTVWVQVFTYSFGIALIYSIISGNMSVMELVKAALPVTTSKYWYFSAYTGLFFIMPWLNRFVASLTDKQSNQMMIVLFAVFSCYTTVSKLIGDGFVLMGGYSFVWLAILYVAGAWMKKNSVAEKLSPKIWFVIMLGMTVFSWGWRMIVPAGYGNFLFFTYLSPTVIGISMCLISIFATMRVTPKLHKSIKIVSPAAFGVYIIHSHWIVWANFIVGRFEWVSQYGGVFTPLLLLAASFAVFAVCLVTELVRLGLFKVLGVQKLIEKLQTVIDKIINKTMAMV
ncbi:MAG: acyltransferase [Oscillospiraceae bacterium]|nr:acyltransferase [Oscillospiraceae bacterium]MBP1571987.1 acyltransferase [Oscillospiraceae bacterium]